MKVCKNCRRPTKKGQLGDKLHPLHEGTTRMKKGPKG